MWPARTALTRCPVCREAIPVGVQGWRRHRDTKHSFSELFEYGWTGPHHWVFRGLMVGLFTLVAVLLAVVIGGARPFTWWSVGWLAAITAWSGLIFWHHGRPVRLPRLRAVVLAVTALGFVFFTVVSVFAELGWDAVVAWVFMSVAHGKSAVTAWRYPRRLESDTDNHRLT